MKAYYISLKRKYSTEKVKINTRDNTKSYQIITTRVWFCEKKVYTPNTTFYSLFIPMTNKNIITWLVIVWVITAVWLFVSFVSNADAKVKPTVKDQCFLSGSIDACVQLDKQNKETYKKLTEVLSGIANDNAKVKEHTQKLLSWSSFQ